MVSVLIPIYNADVRQLVKQLADDMRADGIEGEIVCMDDCSKEQFKNTNEEIINYPLVRYNKLSRNLGRSAIRNALVREARYSWLLFLDCDMSVVNKGTVKKYLDETEKGAQVVYGGTFYGESPTNPNHLLHWKYGVERECVPVAKRKLNPYGTFKTNNFCIQKSILEQIPFDETVKGYGHEDTLFALELGRKGISLSHIDNPLLHLGLEQQEEFLGKQFNAIKNLAVLYKKGKLGDEIRLIRVYNKVKRWRLVFLLKWFYLKSEDKLKQNLLSATPKMTNLDRLKLGWFLRELRKGE